MLSIIYHKYKVMISENERAIGLRLSLTIKCALSFSYHNTNLKNEEQGYR